MHWRVAGSDLYLLGSVHFSDRDLIFSDEISSAIARAEVLAFEADTRLQPDRSAMRYSKNGRLSANIPPDLFADTARLWAELELPPDDLEKARPASAMFQLMRAVLERSGFDKPGVDRLVLARGEAQGKKLMFLEPILAGFEAFRSAPLEEQVAGLAFAVRHQDEGVSDVRATLDAWAASRPQDMLPVGDRGMQRTPRTYTAAIRGRNKTWLPKILKLIRAGRPTVVTVGGLHLVGTDSVPELLKRHGYECVLGAA